MDSLLKCRVLVFIALVTLEAVGAPRLSAASYTHKGRVFDAVDRHWIAADFNAYASEKPAASEGNCLHFEGNPIDHGTSDGTTGVFTVTLIDGPSTYTMSYCRPGYTPRALTGNDNDMDKVPVRGPEIRLCPTNCKMTAALQNLHNDARAAILAVASSNPSAFREAVQNLPAPSRTLVQSLASIQLVQLRSAAASPEQIAAYLKVVLEELDSDLVYLRGVNTELFDGALESLKELRDYARDKKLLGH